MTALDHLKALHEAVFSRLSVDNPTPDERLCLWRAYKDAGAFLEQEKAKAEKSNNQNPPTP